MIEKVNPSHPDKVADRIAGAIVDLAYSIEENPKIAVEVLIGHKECYIVTETNVKVNVDDVEKAVHRIAGENINVIINGNRQDTILAMNQEKGIRCGDNGIFKGVPLTTNEKEISMIARIIYEKWGYDGKYILTDEKFICCQSNASNEELKDCMGDTYFGREVIINPLGEWTGGINTDSGATNRKLGSDMAQSVTGGGLHGKDLSKADVSVNIYVFLKAQEKQKTVYASCAIGDKRLNIYTEGEDEVLSIPYSKIVEVARNYINKVGGFEKFAEWGLF